MHDDMQRKERYYYAKRFMKLEYVFLEPGLTERIQRDGTQNKAIHLHLRNTSRAHLRHKVLQSLDIYM